MLHIILIGGIEMAKGIDRAVKFKTLRDLQEIAKLGYTFVGRYLTHSPASWKALDKQEAKLISDAGMYVVSVYQGSGNRADYFTQTQGVIDAHRALDAAGRVGMPKNGVIYFAVDYDTSKYIDGVYKYFNGVSSVLSNTAHRIGVYGSYKTCTNVPRVIPEVDFKWQTLAWSQGKKCDYNLYQHKIDTYIPENKKLQGYDLNLSNGNGGGWKV